MSSRGRLPAKLSNIWRIYSPEYVTMGRPMQSPVMHRSPGIKMIYDIYCNIQTIMVNCYQILIWLGRLSSVACSCIDQNTQRLTPISLVQVSPTSIMQNSVGICFVLCSNLSTREGLKTVPSDVLLLANLRWYFRSLNPFNLETKYFPDVWRAPALSFVKNVLNNRRGTLRMPPSLALMKDIMRPLTR